jgi:hypothetical protein
VLYETDSTRLYQLESFRIERNSSSSKSINYDSRIIFAVSTNHLIASCCVWFQPDQGQNGIDDSTTTNTGSMMLTKMALHSNPT